MAEVIDVPAKLLNMASPCCDAALTKNYTTYVCVTCRRVYSLVTDNSGKSERNQSMPSQKRGTRVVDSRTQSPTATQESYMDTKVEPGTVEVLTKDPEDLATAGLDKPAATTAAPAKTVKERRVNGALETLVKAVTDAYVQGQIDTDGKPLTPYRIARLIDEKFPSNIKTSTGAVTECLKRWKEYGFATFADGEDTPMAFGGYTDDARANGLKALKARYRENNKAAKDAAKASKAEETPEDEPAVAGV